MATNHPQTLTPELDEFYAKYGSHQTIAQKINILEKELGKSQFYASDGEVSEQTKLACLECEWLELHNLIELELA